MGGAVPEWIMHAERVGLDRGRCFGGSSEATLGGCAVHPWPDFAMKQDGGKMSRQQKRS